MRKPNHLMATFWAVLILGAGLTGCKTPQQDVAKYKYLLDDKNTTVADRVEHGSEVVADNDVVDEGPMRGEPEKGGPEAGMPVSDQIRTVISKAKTYLGTPYRYGGINQNGLDCSGLTTLSYRTIGVELPRSSKDQSKFGTPIKRKEIKPGDLVFFTAKNNGKIDHVGMVTSVKGSEVTFIHATTRKGVRFDQLNTGYWKNLFMSARRPGVH